MRGTASANDITARLAYAVERRGITGGELAAAVGASPGAVSQWLSGRKQPTRENVQKLAEALDVALEWLELGVGEGPGLDLASERAAYEDHAMWWFRPQPSDGGRDYGNANIWSFRPDLATFGRETGQNIVDVRREATVEATYRLIQLRGDDLAAFQRAIEWEKLRLHLDSASAGDQKLGRFLLDGLERIDREGELLLLRVEDRGAIGLIGEEFESGNFTALCRNNLDSQKAASTAGGAFGLGKAALWLTSRISTVLFNSHLSQATIAGERDTRVFGRVELGWHEVEDRRYAGPGWFGFMDEQRGCTVSYWGNEALARDLHLDRATTEPGTSILVVGFHDPTGESDQPAYLADRLESALANHFFPALSSGEFRATVEFYEGSRPKSSNVVDPSKHLPEFALLLSDYAAGKVDEVLGEPGDSVRRLVPLRIPERRSTFDNPHGELTHNAVLLVRSAEDPEAAMVNHVALFRGPGLVVKYLDLSNLAGARPFHAVVLCGEAAGDEASHRAAERFLRAAEPPAHNDWTSTQDLKVEYELGGKKALDDFYSDVKRAVKELVTPFHEDLSDGPRALKELLKITGGAEPRLQPRIVDPTGVVNNSGAWEVEATVRVKPSPGKVWRGRPVAIFNAETGSGEIVAWAKLEAVRGCKVSGDHLSIPAGVREAKFKGITDPAGHPVPASDSTLTIEFRTI
jgi:transcriptional regulator with XRE-family HTH domain